MTATGRAKARPPRSLAASRAAARKARRARLARTPEGGLPPGIRAKPAPPSPLAALTARLDRICTESSGVLRAFTALDRAGRRASPPPSPAGGGRRPLSAPPGGPRPAKRKKAKRKKAKKTKKAKRKKAKKTKKSQQPKTPTTTTTKINTNNRELQLRAFLAAQRAQLRAEQDDVDDFVDELRARRAGSPPRLQCQLEEEAEAAAAARLALGGTLSPTHVARDGELALEPQVAHLIAQLRAERERERHGPAEAETRRVWSRAHEQRFEAYRERRRARYPSTTNMDAMLGYLSSPAFQDLEPALGADKRERLFIDISIRLRQGGDGLAEQRVIDAMREEAAQSKLSKGQPQPKANWRAAHRRAMVLVTEKHLQRLSTSHADAGPPDGDSLSTDDEAGEEEEQEEEDDDDREAFRARDIRRVLSQPAFAVPAAHVQRNRVRVAGAPLHLPSAAEVQRMRIVKLRRLPRSRMSAVQASVTATGHRALANLIVEERERLADKYMAARTRYVGELQSLRAQERTATLRALEWRKHWRHKNRLLLKEMRRAYTRAAEAWRQRDRLRRAAAGGAQRRASTAAAAGAGAVSHAALDKMAFNDAVRLAAQQASKKALGDIDVRTIGADANPKNPGMSRQSTRRSVIVTKDQAAEAASSQQAEEPPAQPQAGGRRRRRSVLVHRRQSVGERQEGANMVGGLDINVLQQSAAAFVEAEAAEAAAAAADGQPGPTAELVDHAHTRTATHVAETMLDRADKAKQAVSLHRAIKLYNTTKETTFNAARSLRASREYAAAVHEQGGGTSLRDVMRDRRAARYRGALLMQRLFRGISERAFVRALKMLAYYWWAHFHAPVSEVDGYTTVGIFEALLQRFGVRLSRAEAQRAIDELPSVVDRAKPKSAALIAYADFVPWWRARWPPAREAAARWALVRCVRRVEQAGLAFFTDDLEHGGMKQPTEDEQSWILKVLRCFASFSNTTEMAPHHGTRLPLPVRVFHQQEARRKWVRVMAKIGAEPDNYTTLLRPYCDRYRVFEFADDDDDESEGEAAAAASSSDSASDSDDSSDDSDSDSDTDEDGDEEEEEEEEDEAEDEAEAEADEDAEEQQDQDQDQEQTDEDHHQAAAAALAQLVAGLTRGAQLVRTGQLFLRFASAEAQANHEDATPVQRRASLITAGLDGLAVAKARRRASVTEVDAPALPFGGVKLDDELMRLRTLVQSAQNSHRLAREARSRHDRPHATRRYLSRCLRPVKALASEAAELLTRSHVKTELPQAVAADVSFSRQMAHVVKLLRRALRLVPKGSRGSRG